MIPITFENFHFHLKEFEQKLELGSGAYGKVFYNKLQNRDVAIKRIEDSEETFREANRHKYVNGCKFIVEILGVAFDENDMARGLVLELCHESTLHKAIIGRKVYTLYNVTHIVLWMEQLASALVYLKQKELVHRDLKPAK